MSIRPADMQIVVHKTQDIHPAKQTVVSKGDNELLMAQEKMKSEVAIERKKIAKTEHSEMKKVKNDESGKKKHSKKNSHSQKDDIENEENQKSKPDVNPVGSKFDMKV